MQRGFVIEKYTANYFLSHAKEVILPYWCRESLRDPKGGFFSTADSYGQVIPTDKKGCVQHARLLWSFSEAYLAFGENIYLQLARHAFKYLVDAHWDKNHGGWYFYTHDSGAPLDTRKHLYAQSFALYGLSSYFLASGDFQAGVLADKTFDLIMRYGEDHIHGGFNESFTSDWIKCQQIDEFGMVGDYKTMNSHIHILEAFTAYHTKRCHITDPLKKTIDIIIDKIYHFKSHSFQLYFTADWKCKKEIISYGHDIETSWLLIKASKSIDGYRLAEILDMQKKIGDKLKEKAIDPIGLIYNENEDKTFYWWVQAEGALGFAYMNDWATVAQIWEGINLHLVDSENGEWFETPELRQRKIYVWKTPYHHLRSALELAAKARELYE